MLRGFLTPRLKRAALACSPAAGIDLLYLSPGLCFLAVLLVSSLTYRERRRVAGLIVASIGGALLAVCVCALPVGYFAPDLWDLYEPEEYSGLVLPTYRPRWEFALEFASSPMNLAVLAALFAWFTVFSNVVLLRSPDFQPRGGLGWMCGALIIAAPAVSIVVHSLDDGDGDIRQLQAVAAIGALPILISVMMAQAWGASSREGLDEDKNVA